ncbi:MAG: phosphatidylglycerophosphatase A [Desulfobacteraceae bacterium]|nr:phosphatidylglycerophosphatase A [Desulfobacteraceae bacterium]MBC2754736.1 phosphatidylglycerophosphatase A [Desulfobacteraceae bacterium]
MKNSSKLFIGLATGGYIGLIPFAPGTFGSVLGIPFYYFMSSLPLLPAFSLLVAFILFSVWVAGKGERSLKAKDPGCIVIDEIAGMGVTFFAIPFNIYLAIIGFIVFRFFDILKPFPVNYLEKRFTGGLGVVIDDVAAGIMSNIVLQIILLVMR